MAEKAAEILKEALPLSEEERGELASALLESLDPMVDDGVEQAWEEEIARRIHEIDSGKVKTVSWEEAKKRIQSALTDDK